MHFNLYNSLMLAGIIQGVIFALVVLCSKKYRAPGTMLLGAFILSFSLDNLQFYFEDVGLITEYELMGTYFIPFQLLSGPLFLLYGLSLINPQRKISRKQLWLFFPFILALCISTTYKITINLGYRTGFSEMVFDYMESWLEFTSIAFDLSVLCYVYYRVDRAVKHNTFPTDYDAGTRLSWFRIVLVTLFMLSLVWLYVTIVDYFYDTEYWYVIYIGMSGIIYWMGHVGIYRYGIEQERKKIRSYSIEHKAAHTPGKQKNEHIAALEKLLVEERRFLDPTLSLDDMAKALNLSKSHLSRTINAELGMGFPDYLNALRVEEAKSYLTNPEFANYTLVAIGLEAGFNSKTTFNTAFKKLTSLTPSEYRNSGQK